MKRTIVCVYAILTIAMFVWWKWPVHRVYPDFFELNTVHYLEQPDDITCGPTSLVMLLELYGQHHSINEVKQQTKTTWISYAHKNIGMTSPEYIAIAAKQFKVSSHMSHGSLDDLKYFVSQKRPPIVLLRSGKSTWHYVLVIGYTKNIIVVADPGRGAKRVMNVQDFLGAWNFSTNMGGGSIVSKCSICRGSGRIGSINLGPLNICDNCAGSGESPDYVLFAVRAAEISSRTMIVPNIPCD